MNIEAQWNQSKIWFDKINAISMESIKNMIKASLQEGSGGMLLLENLES